MFVLFFGPRKREQFLRPSGAFSPAHAKPRARARGYYLSPLPGLLMSGRFGDGAIQLQWFDLESGGFALGAAATPQGDVVEEGVANGGDQ